MKSLLGKYVVVWCLNYIYSGKLVEESEHEIKLDEAVVVYETGELGAKKFKDAQALPNSWYVRVNTIESYGERGF